MELAMIQFRLTAFSIVNSWPEAFESAESSVHLRSDFRRLPQRQPIIFENASSLRSIQSVSVFRSCDDKNMVLHGVEFLVYEVPSLAQRQISMAKVCRSPVNKVLTMDSSSSDDHSMSETGVASSAKAVFADDILGHDSPKLEH
jgi:hypothetical protein